MQLKDTIEMMNSPEYKDRFKAEYLQLKIRIEGLSIMLEKYKAGTLPFTPTCSYELLNTQLNCMHMYALNLEKRAEIEEIDLK
jgi:hypothetical protein